jgi:Holliday junction resolvase
MSARSRNKGSSAEREVAGLLHDHLGIAFARNLEQVRADCQGDLTADCDGWPFSIEIKRRAVANGCDPAWELQAMAAAQKAGTYPAVIYRGDRRPWRVRLYSDALAEAFGGLFNGSLWIETDIEGFAGIAREILARRAA